MIDSQQIRNAYFYDSGAIYADVYYYSAIEPSQHANYKDKEYDYIVILYHHGYFKTVGDYLNHINDKPYQLRWRTKNTLKGKITQGNWDKRSIRRGADIMMDKLRKQIDKYLDKYHSNVIEFPQTMELKNDTRHA